MKTQETDGVTAHNNVKLAEANPDRRRYLFVDSKEHHGDRIIMGALIPAKFEPLVEEDTRNRELPESEDGPGFELRICSFDARYESWFLCCMADLEWVLQGKGEYLRACEHLLGAPAIIRSACAELARQLGRSKAAKESCIPVVPPAGLGRLSLKPAEG